MNVVVLAEFELKPAFVVGCNFDLNIDVLTGDISGHNCSCGIFATWSLILPFAIPWVSTYSAFPIINFPLSLKITK